LNLALALSDIDFLRWAVEGGVNVGSADEAIRVELRHYEFSKSDEAYRAHYAHHEGKFYAGPAKDFVRADWSQNERYRRVRDYVASCVARGARRVMDFGCATGHISRLLAREFPQCNFVGTDVVPQAIELYNSLASHNARAYLYSQCVEDRFDVIICAEVLEHVRDPYATLRELCDRFGNTDVQFICTLPQGPWESQGWKSNPGGREHLRHWDAVDLAHIFGQSAVVSHVGGGLGPYGLGLGLSGLPLGHCVTLSGPAVGQVDMEAKMQRYRASAYVQPAIALGMLR
jgi:SAM-dependent methyltransferase